MAKSAPAHDPQPLRVAVLVYEGSSAWVATALREAFEFANLLQASGARDRARIGHVQWISATGDAVFASAGIQVRLLCSDEVKADVLLVPPIWHVSPDDFVARLKGLQPEVDLIRQFAERGGATVASVCSGVALLAAAGLLEGRSATGCWWLEKPLRRLYPGVKWVMTQTVVHSGPVMTAGAWGAYAGLVYELLQRAGGREVATRTAQFLGIEPNQTGRSPYVNLVPLQLSDDLLVARFERYVQAHLAAPGLDTGRVAQLLGTSPRTLIRRVKEATGHTPSRMIQLTRLEHAKSLLADTALSTERICERCGWSDVSSFRKLFAREIGLTAGAWRKSFCTNQQALNT
jgi:transcriptional regulator GlxA family with amidase domain